METVKTTNSPIFCMEPYVHVDILIENSSVTKKVCNIFYGNNTHNEVIEMHNKGVWPAGCAACCFLEQNNLKSRRLGINELYKNQKITNLDHIQSVSLRYGTLCNLKCVICDDSRSSTWASENLKFNKKVKEKYIYSKKELPSINKVLEGIDITKVKSWDFHGGEPLLANYPWEILNISNPDAYFKFNTNGTVFPKNINDFVGKNVELIFSIDDIEDRFEYQRFPAKWKTVEENIKKFKNLGFKISVTPTISNINVWHFPYAVEWFLKTFGTKIYLQFVDFPKNLAINNLNAETKKQLLFHYEKFNKIQKITDPIVKKINSAGNELDFLSYINKIDKRRNQNFFVTFDKWGEILENTMHR